MMFYRIVDGRVADMTECDRLGWSLNGEHYLIPDEALEEKKFLIYRTVHGVGDWGIITVMPRLLKEAYPDCKVYVPSISMLTTTWGHSDRHNGWLNPYEIPSLLFKNNPYVDGVVDVWSGEVYHDHFRIVNDQDVNDPLVLQMLRFHGVNVDTNTDYLPELYFSEEEQSQYELIRKQLFGDSPYITFSARRSIQELSTAWNSREKAEYMLSLVTELVKEYSELPALTYNSTGLDFNLNVVANAEGIPLRTLLYLISNASAAIGQQTGVYDTCSRYTNVKVVPHSNTLAENYLKSVNYLHLEK